MQHPHAPLLLTAFLITAAPAMRAAEVTTADNASPANDGKTSLLEALTNVQNNETISFKIPGDGPHYIVTPVAGYPLITKSGVTIDGYTQPGSAPNTAAPDQPKNTKIQIILDSRTDQPAERRTVILHDGFGDSESCMIGFLDAPHGTVRGLSFLGVPGDGSSADPGVYCIALVEGSIDAKIQGCWFGLDAGKTSWTPGPDGIVSGVAGTRAAVAGFAGGTDATNLIFGTDGDGVGDRGEGNLAMAQGLAVAMTANKTRVSGNWFNMYPDGSFLNLGAWTGDRVSFIENGDGRDMLIGTNGDGVSDAEEGNWFGPTNYQEFVEFYRATAVGVVFAGNHVGTALDGTPAFTSPGSRLLFIRGNAASRGSASARIGTDGNGTADRAEANHVYGVGSSSTPFLGIREIVSVSVRGNALMACGGPVPFNYPLMTQTSIEKLLQDFLTPPANPEDPWEDAVKLNAASTAVSVSGTYPVQLDGVSKPVIDLYIADSTGLALPEGPSVQGRYWLGAFDAASAANQEATLGKFKFDTTALALTPSELALLTATATYKLQDDSFVTTNFSETLQPYTVPPALGGVTFAPAAQAGRYNLSWTGGIGPFQVVSSTALTGPWAPISTVSAQTTEITPSFTTEPRKFYRVREGASPR